MSHDVYTGVVMPRITYADVDAALPYLKAAFGMSEDATARYLDEAGRVVVAEICCGAQRLLLGKAGNHGQVSPAQQDGANTQMVIVYVRDVDAHCARAEAAGVEIVMGLNDAPWGERRYEALDLEGHRWAFHQTVGRS